MRAELKSVDSPDVDFEIYWPEDETCFSFPITLRIGPEGSNASDIFQMRVCTPGWLSNQSTSKTAVLGGNLLIAFGYNWPMIRSHLDHRINRMMADDWPALALKLSRLARWEFENYRENIFARFRRKKMRAELKSISSADIDLDSYSPEDEDCFSFPIEMAIGYEGGEGGDLFQMTVCTPAWIARENQGKTAVIGTALLIVFRYDWPEILSAIRHIAGGHSADDWTALAQKLSRIADWEFEDYRPYQG
jgi:hypothetical protein